jgi:hypothetical protein
MHREECRKIFEWDGSWRDIYVLGTDVHDWQKLLDFLRAYEYPIKYYQAGEEVLMPERAGQIFAQRGVVAPLLSVDVRGVTVISHFFWPGDIEFDIDPREVSEESRVEGIFDFMERVGRLLEKDVILTPENMQEIALVRYDSTANTIKYQFVEWR